MILLGKWYPFLPFAGYLSDMVFVKKVQAVCTPEMCGLRGAFMLWIRYSYFDVKCLSG